MIIFCRIMEGNLKVHMADWESVLSKDVMDVMDSHHVRYQILG